MVDSLSDEEFAQLKFAIERREHKEETKELPEELKQQLLKTRQLLVTSFKEIPAEKKIPTLRAINRQLGLEN